MKSYLLAIDYHYVGPKERYPYCGMQGITVEEFESQLRELSRYFEFVGIDDLRKAVLKTDFLPPRSAVITFDDGLKEQFENALPVLDKMHIPFIFFVNSFPLSEKKVMLVHKIHYLRSVLSSGDFRKIIEEEAKGLSAAPVSFNHLEKNIPSGIYPYDDQEARVTKYILNFLLPKEEARKIIERIFAGYGEEGAFCDKFYMSQEEIKFVHGKYRALGLHGHSHVSLADLQDQEAKREIKLCKEILEALVSDKLACMSYPYGYAQTVSLREERLAKEAGFDFCFTMEMCFNRDVTIAPHLLGRINNNEAPGHNQAAFKFKNGDFVILNEAKMKYYRSQYYCDL